MNAKLTWKLASERPRSLKLKIIETNGGTQTRFELNEATAQEYSESIKELPPVDVFWDGENYILADGFHRYRAHEIAGKDTIRCRVFEGTERDAILYSAGANAKHGLRRSVKDRRNAVTKLLHDDEWRGRSDRWIAKRCDVSPDTVGRIRLELYPPPETVLKDSPDREPRVGADGVERTPPMPARQPVPKPTGKRKKSGSKMSQEPQARGPQYDADGNEISSGEDLPAYCKRCGEIEGYEHDCQPGGLAPFDEEDARLSGQPGTRPPATDAPDKVVGWVCTKEACGAPNEPWATICKWCGADPPIADAEPAPPPLPGKPPPAPLPDSKPVRVPTRVDLTEVELAALHCVTESDANVHAELFDDWERTEGRGECVEADARGAVVKLGVRFE